MGLYEVDGKRVVTPASGNYWVADTARVIGNVELGEDVSIWYGSVVRGDNDAIRIGAGSNIQDNCMLHVDPGFPIEIGENVSIGHMVMLHGCSIGSGSLVGIGAIVLNGAKIGEQCLIGAGSLIPEGKVIPARSLVMGAPGKVVRELTDADLVRASRGAPFYRRNWRLFRDTLKPQT